MLAIPSGGVCNKSDAATKKRHGPVAAAVNTANNNFRPSFVQSQKLSQYLTFCSPQSALRCCCWIHVSATFPAFITVPDLVWICHAMPCFVCKNWGLHPGVRVTVSSFHSTATSTRFCWLKNWDPPCCSVPKQPANAAPEFFNYPEVLIRFDYCYIIDFCRI